MAYVHVDVDMDEFETYELCDELLRRLKSFRKTKPKPDEIIQLKEAINDLAVKLGLNFGGIVEGKSLDDKLKMEFLASVWNKYTYWQLEEKLK